MKTIVVAASKGGVGKTTLVAALAVEATRHATVAVMDLDPQLSLTRWHHLRMAEDEDSVPYLIEAGKRPEASIARAKKQKLDWLIIDTPGGSLTRMKLAVDSADLVVIPVRPSPIDVESMNAIVELCDIGAKPWAFVLNGVQHNSHMTDGARTYLRTRFGNVLTEEVQLNDLHVEAMLNGSTAGELDGSSDAARDIRSLWSTLDRLARNPAELLQSRRKKSAS